MCVYLYSLLILHTTNHFKHTIIFICFFGVEPEWRSVVVEVLDTDVDIIDDNIDQIGHIQTLTMISVGRTATATAGICTTGSSVKSITITNMGGSYDFQPFIGFSSSPTGETAVGVASITNIYTNCNGEYGGKIAHINLVNAGCGYTEPPWITITGGGGTGAAATTGIGTGSLQVITVTDGGAGYTTAPNVTFSSPQFFAPTSDSNAVTVDSDGYSMDTESTSSLGDLPRGHSVINSAGVVTAIYISYAGSGYSQPPIITIDGPVGLGTGVGIGTFIFNEVVTGSISSTRGRVKKWTKSTNSLEVAIVDGDWTAGEIITGADSGAVYKLGSIQEFDLVTPYADNDTIETESLGIIDFTETNPFAE